MADRESGVEEKGASLGDQEAVCGDTEGGMVMETAPPAPLIIAEAEFLLQLLIVALDAPAQLDEIDQTLKADLLGQCGKPIFGRLGVVLQPLDQQPLFGAWLAQLGITMCRPHALPGEPR